MHGEERACRGIGQHREAATPRADRDGRREGFHTAEFLSLSTADPGGRISLCCGSAVVLCIVAIYQHLWLLLLEAISKPLPV